MPWNHGQPWEGDAANSQHILARGETHLPYAKPQFGTDVEVRRMLTALPLLARCYFFCFWLFFGME